MKKYVEKITLAFIWVFLSLFLYKKGFSSIDLNKIKNIIENEPFMVIAFFLFMSVVRVFLFIPSSAFMILCGLCFNPIVGFILSILAIAISETIIFAIGKLISGGRIQGYLNKRYKSIMSLTNKYGLEFLALGILCPIAPTDVVCFIAAILNFGYKKYISTVILANTPIVLVYNYLGKSTLEFEIENIALFVVIAILLIYTIYIWLKVKDQEENCM